MNKLDNLLKQALDNQSKINETLKFIKDNNEHLTEEHKNKLGEVKTYMGEEILPEIDKLQKTSHMSEVKRSFSFTYDDLKKAFYDGKLYGFGELPLIEDFDFSDKPGLTEFDVWFNDWFNKNYKRIKTRQ